VGRLVLAAWLVLLQAVPAEDFGTRLARAAVVQVGVTLHYDPSYRRIDYPGGDVPIDRGVCTDVVIRAYRSLGTDLQLLVHRDMKRNWSRYPKLWGLKRPDPNIDHRRVPNLQVFFRRHGKALRVSSRAADYAAGDLVTWHLPSGLPHIGIVSDRHVVPSRRPLIVHNIGEGARIEDILFEYRITGHYRFVGTAADRRAIGEEVLGERS